MAETMWECPYCGKQHTEEMARLKGCCGELHCVEVPAVPVEEPKGE